MKQRTYAAATVTLVFSSFISVEALTKPLVPLSIRLRGGWADKEVVDEFDAYVDRLIDSDYDNDDCSECITDSNGSTIYASKKERKLAEHPPETNQMGFDVASCSSSENEICGVSQLQRMALADEDDMDNRVEVDLDTDNSKPSKHYEMLANGEAQRQNPAHSPEIALAHNDLKDGAANERPHSFYRFWLQKGFVGHTIVMATVLLHEMVRNYVPQASRFCCWIFVRFFPTKEKIEDSKPGYVQNSHGSKRTGISGKQRREMVRHADQTAFEQLKKIKDVTKAKYRYISVDFQTRHCLGDLDSNVCSSVTTNEQPQKFDVPDETNDNSWVVDVLTRERKSENGGALNAGTPDSVLETDLPFSDLASRNIHRQSVVQAATRREQNRKRARSSGPRLSDRNGGDGLLGRLRVAAGTDSILSRSLLGAYPGDAVHPSEAASPNGVAALAEKYGWGAWTEEEAFKRERKRKTRLRKVRRETAENWS